MVSAVQSNNNTVALPLQPASDVRQKAQTAINTQLEQLINNLQEIQNTNNKQNTNTWLDEIKNFIQQNLIILLSSMAGISLLVGGIILSSRSKKTPEINKVVEENNTVIPENNEKIENNTERKTQSREQIICRSVKAGNAGFSCHTMATLNAIRAYYALEGKTIPEWFNDGSNGKNEAFRIIKQKDPQIGAVLQDNGYIENSTGETTKIPQIILDHLNISSKKFFIIDTYTGGSMLSPVLKFAPLIHVLAELEKKKIGVLTMSDRGGHLVTCYGFKQGNNFRDFINSIQTAKQIENTNWYQLNKNNQLRELIEEGDLGKIQIYDQHRNTHESIELSDLLLGKYCSVCILNPDIT